MSSVSRTSSEYATSYERNYTYKEAHNRRSTGRHITLPSLQVKSSPNFIAMNLHEPKGPHRVLNASDAVGVGGTTTSDCIRYHIEKPIVRSPRPQDFHVSLQQFAKKKSSRSAHDADTAVERLLLERKWTTTTKKATEETALPTVRPIAPNRTLEECADPVTCRLVKSHRCPMLWQQLGRRWDAVQMRDPMPPLGKQKDEFILPKVHAQKTECNTDTTKRSRSKTCKSTNCPHPHLSRPIISSKPTTSPLPKTNRPDPLFLRPIPGYGGFVSRHPMAVRPMTDKECLCTTSRQTYRHFPPEEYRRLEHSHKGPLSMTVTLTYPHTPFSGRS